MNRYLKRFKKELVENGLKLALSKSFKNISIRSKRKITLNNRSQMKWKEIKGSYFGKRVFLIGNGPSLNKTSLYLLENEEVICFNRFTIMLERLSWLPSFYMCVDPLVGADMAPELNEMTEKAKYAFFPDIHTNGVDFRKFVEDKDNILWMFPEFKGFYFDLPKVGLGGSVAYPALQVLTYLGFSEIILIGVDMNYQIHKTVTDIQGTDVVSNRDDDPNHFDPRYFGTNRKYHQPVSSIVDNIMSSFEFASQAISKNSKTKVYNAGIGSKVECFPKIDFESLFNFSENERFHLFSLKFMHLFPVDSFEQLKETIPSIHAVSEVDTDIEAFICSLDLGYSLIKDLVFDYLYFGPYDGMCLFISRKLFENNN